MEYWKNVIHYIIHPTIVVQRERPSIKNLLSLVFLNYVLIIPFGILLVYVTKQFGLEDMTQIEMTKGLAVAGVFIIPFYEEIMFRLWLVPTKRNYYFVLVTFFLLLVFSIIKKSTSGIIIEGSLLIIFLAVYFVDRNQLKSFYQKYFKFIFWGSAFVFGLLHAFNYQGSFKEIVALSIILGSRQIITGLIFGYARMNYGYFYGVLLHMSINVLALFHYFK